MKNVLPWVTVAIVASLLLYFGIRAGARLPPLILKVDYPDHPIRFQDWDPAHSRMDMDVSLVQALYSPLLELDEQARLKAGWVANFTWQNPHTLVLKLRDDKRLADGTVLTARDAALSLKRLAFLQQDKHAFYVEQFCHAKKLPDLQAPCPGLSFQGQTLTIQTRDPLNFLPQLLTAVETSVVPQAWLSEDQLKIKSHDHGSGPYILRAMKDGENPVLEANPHHFNFSPQMPQIIELISGLDASVESLGRDFQERKIDHIARFSSLNVVEFKELADQLKEEAYAVNTLPLGIGLLFFSTEAREKLSVEVRQELVLRLQAATHSCLIQAGHEQLRRPTKVLIPASGLGMLKQDELNQLEKARKAHRKLSIRQPIRVRFPESLGQEMLPCLGQLVKDQPIVFNRSGTDKADLRFTSFDMSNYEEVGSLKSLLLSGFLDPEDHGPEGWINLYIAEQDPQKRMAMLKRAHLRAIWDAPSIIPLWNYDTGALIRKPWVMKFSPLTVLNPFHRISYGS